MTQNSTKIVKEKTVETEDEWILIVTQGHVEPLLFVNSALVLNYFPFFLSKQ